MFSRELSGHIERSEQSALRWERDKERRPCLPRVPLGQGRSTSMPLWVWGHIMSLFSIALQKRSGKGKDSRGGGEGVCGITGRGLGAPLLRSLYPVVVVLLSTPQCTVVVVVVVVVFVGGVVVTSENGGAVQRERKNRSQYLGGAPLCDLRWVGWGWGRTRRVWISLGYI